MLSQSPQLNQTMSSNSALPPLTEESLKYALDLLIKQTEKELDIASMMCGNIEKTLEVLKAERSNTVIANYFGLPVIQHKGLEDN